MCKKCPYSELFCPYFPAFELNTRDTISSYSFRIRENKLRIGTLFKQWIPQWTLSRRRDSPETDPDSHLHTNGTQYSRMDQVKFAEESI